MGIISTIIGHLTGGKFVSLAAQDAADRMAVKRRTVMRYATANGWHKHYDDTIGDYVIRIPVKFLKRNSKKAEELLSVYEYFDYSKAVSEKEYLAYESIVVDFLRFSGHLHTVKNADGILLFPHRYLEKFLSEFKEQKEERERNGKAA